MCQVTKEKGEYDSKYADIINGSQPECEYQWKLNFYATHKIFQKLLFLWYYQKNHSALGLEIGK